MNATKSPKAPKLHTIFSDRTNAQGVRFREVKTGTLDYFCDYYGIKATTIKSLISKVNRMYDERYSQCFILSRSISLAAESEKIEFATQVVTR